MKIVEYRKTEAALAALADKYKDAVFPVDTAKGMASAKEARAEVRGYRVDLEKKRKELKADVLERGRMIDGEAKRITEALEALENPIDGQIKAEESRKEAERKAKAEAEKARVDSIKSKLDLMAGYPITAVGKHSSVIRSMISDLSGVEIIGFDEFTEEAELVKEKANLTMGEILVRAEKQESERAELERLKAESELNAKIEADRIKAERDRQEAELREQRKAEQARIAAERAEHEAAMKAEREAQQAEHQRMREAQAIADAKAREEREAEEARIAEHEAMIRAEEDAYREDAQRTDHKKTIEEAEKTLQGKLEAIASNGKHILEQLREAYELGKGARQ